VSAQAEQHGIRASTVAQYNLYRPEGMTVAGRAVQLAMGGDCGKPKRLHLTMLRRRRATR
jgi:hypothetical protein